jgi:exonuclease VII small subunit
VVIDSDVNSLKRDQMVDSSADNTRTSPPTSKPTNPSALYETFDTVKKSIKVAVDAVKEGFEIYETISEELITLIDDATSTWVGVTDTMVDAIDFPFSSNSDVGSSMNATPNSKTDVNKACGNLALGLARDTTNAVRQYASNIRSSIDKIGNVDTSFSWKHAAVLGYDTLMTSLTQYDALISDTVSNCRVLYDIVKKSSGSGVRPKTNTALDELINYVSAAKVQAESGYSQYMSHSFFDRTKWNSATSKLKEAYTYMDENYGVLTSDSANDQSESLLKVYDRIRLISYNLCLLSKNSVYIDKIATNINKVSIEKPDSGTTMQASTIIDRVGCYLDYIIKELIKQKAENTVVGDGKFLDIYVSLKELYSMMSGLGKYIDQLLEDEQKEFTKTILFDTDDMSSCIVNCTMFISTVSGYLQDVMYSVKSNKMVDRLPYVLTALESGASELMAAIKKYDIGIDTSDEYKKYINDAIMMVDKLKERGGIWYDTLRSGLAAGDYEGIIKELGKDIVGEAYAAALANTFGVVNTFIEKQRKQREREQKSLSLKDKFVEKSYVKTKAIQTKRKRQILTQFSLYKRVVGILDTLNKMKTKYAAEMKNIQAFRDTISVLRKQDKLSAMECQKKL